MYDELTEQDIKKMEEEIEYRKLVVRHVHMATSVKILNTMQQKKTKIRMRAVSVIWRK